jgi:very-short-patch-repair endonuclease
LKGKHVEGIKFRRQEPIGDYIVDFVAFENRLVIEVDGGQHAEEEKDKDILRDAWLSKQGFRVLRFWNNEVLQNLEGVLETIRVNCLRHPPLTPPIKGGEKD